MLRGSTAAALLLWLASGGPTSSALPLQDGESMLQVEAGWQKKAATKRGKKSISHLMYLQQIEVADDPQRWRDIGFAVDDAGICHLDGVEIHLVGGNQNASYPFGLQSFTTLCGTCKEKAVDVGGITMRYRKNATGQGAAASSTKVGANGATRLVHINWGAANYTGNRKKLPKPHHSFLGMGAIWWYQNIDLLEMISDDSGMFPQLEGGDVAELFFEVPDVNKAVKVAKNISEDIIATEPYDGRRQVKLDAPKLGLSVGLYFMEPGARAPH